MSGKKKSKKFLFIIPAIIIIGVLIFIGIQLMRDLIPHSLSSNSFADLKQKAGITDIGSADVLKPTEFGKFQTEATFNDKTEDNREAYNILSGMNKDYTGWLSCKDTVVDYPVMKVPGDDPKYYLHRDFDGNYLVSGNLFMEKESTLNDTVLFVYGNSMDDGSMFGSLESYSDYTYAYKHRDFVFRTEDENRVYRVFSSFELKKLTEYVKTLAEQGLADADDIELFSSARNLDEKQYKRMVDVLRGVSMISFNDSPLYPSQIMFLTVYSDYAKLGKFTVAAYRVG